VPTGPDFRGFLGNDRPTGVFNFIREGVQNYTAWGQPMRRNGVLANENAAHRAQILASIGRGLRERHDAAQPLPDRLADLVREIEQSGESQPKRG
jgi:hypothetical protein